MVPKVAERGDMMGIFLYGNFGNIISAPNY
jgi:hypothetical protein